MNRNTLPGFNAGLTVDCPRGNRYSLGGRSVSTVSTIAGLEIIPSQIEPDVLEPLIRCCLSSRNPRSWCCRILPVVLQNSAPF